MTYENLKTILSEDFYKIENMLSDRYFLNEERIYRLKNLLFQLDEKLKYVFTIYKKNKCVVLVEKIIFLKEMLSYDKTDEEITFKLQELTEELQRNIEELDDDKKNKIKTIYSEADLVLDTIKKLENENKMIEEENININYDNNDYENEEYVYQPQFFSKNLIEKNEVVELEQSKEKDDSIINSEPSEKVKDFNDNKNELYEELKKLFSYFGLDNCINNVNDIEVLESQLDDMKKHQASIVKLQEMKKIISIELKSAIEIDRKSPIGIGWASRQENIKKLQLELEKIDSEIKCYNEKLHLKNNIKQRIEELYNSISQSMLVLNEDQMTEIRKVYTKNIH